MSGTLNKHAFTALLKEDVDWLLANSNPCLEQDHILAVLKEIESLQSELSQVKTEREKLVFVGTQLSNCAFNLAQKSVTLTDEKRVSLKELQVAWDYLRKPLPPTPGCEHEFVSADNEVVSGAEICVKCRHVQAATPDHEEDL